MKGVSRHQRPPKREARAVMQQAAREPYVATPETPIRVFERVLCDWVPSRIVEVPRAPADEVRRTVLWITHFRVPHARALERGLDYTGTMTKAAFMDALGITAIERPVRAGSG